MLKKVRELEIGDRFERVDRFGNVEIRTINSFWWKPKNGGLILTPCDAVQVPKEKATHAGVVHGFASMDEEVKVVGRAPENTIKIDIESHQRGIESHKVLAEFSMKAEEDGLSDEDYIARWLGCDI